MDSARKYLELSCTICESKYTQQERVFKKALWKNRCRTHRFDQDKTKAVSKGPIRGSCMDCGKVTSLYKVDRCITCSNVHRSKPRNNCKDCGAKLVAIKSIRCRPCHNKEQDKGLSRARTKFNASQKWSELRNSCFERDNWTCKVCDKRGSVVLNAHHIKPYAKFPGLRLEISNLETLCHSCHWWVHRDRRNKNKIYTSEGDFTLCSNA